MRIKSTRTLLVCLALTAVGVALLAVGCGEDAKSPTAAKTAIQSEDPGTDPLRVEIQSVAEELLSTFPSAAEVATRPAAQRSFLEDVQGLLNDGARLDQLNDREYYAWAASVNKLADGFDAALSIQIGTGVAGESCTFKCKRERDKCLKDDGCTGGWPCFCCVPCNLTWLACLADCINSKEVTNPVPLPR